MYAIYCLAAHQRAPFDMIVVSCSEEVAQKTLIKLNSKELTWARLLLAHELVPKGQIYSNKYSYYGIYEIENTKWGEYSL